jgi:hypothetical protein
MSKRRITMEPRNYFEDMTPLGECFPLPPFKNGNGNGGGYNTAILTAMLKPVYSSSFTLPTDAETRRNLSEMAWYCDPTYWDSVGEWSDEAIRKMREPAYQGWNIHLSPASLVKLAELG